MGRNMLEEVIDWSSLRELLGLKIPRCSTILTQGSQWSKCQITCSGFLKASLSFTSAYFSSSGRPGSTGSLLESSSLLCTAFPKEVWGSVLFVRQRTSLVQPWALETYVCSLTPEWHPLLHFWNFRNLCISLAPLNLPGAFWKCEKAHSGVGYIESLHKVRMTIRPLAMDSSCPSVPRKPPRLDPFHIYPSFHSLGLESPIPCSVPLCHFHSWCQGWQAYLCICEEK